MVGPSSKLLLVSGTPIQNSINDLGCQLNLIAPDAFPSPNLEYNYGLGKYCSDQDKLKKLQKDLSPFIERKLARGLDLDLKSLWDIVLWVDIEDDECLQK